MILPPPLLSINFFATGNFLKHSAEGFNYEIFRHCETKKLSTENLDTPPPSYPNFFDTRNQCNSKGFPYGSFRHCETKNFRRKILILPPPLLSINFFATGNFLKHSTEGFTCETFQQCEKKISTENLDTPLPPPPLIHKLFRYRKISETQHRRVPLRIFSALWDKKNSTENLDTPPSPLIHKLFRYRKFFETQRRRFQLRNFSALWDKRFSTENLDTPPPLSKNFLATGNFLKHSAEGFNYEIFRHCETK